MYAIDLVKHPGGIFCPVNGSDIEQPHRFKNGETYAAGIKLLRRPAHPRKAFVFFQFRFDYWSADHAGHECSDEQTQYEPGRV